MSLLKFVIFGLLTATGLYYARIYIKGDKCHLSNRIDGKTVFITGGNTGIGLETAVELAKRGGVIHIGCRNAEKCNNARKEIIARSNVDSNKIFTHDLDLASIKSILKFAKHFKQSVPRLDILINNAGVMGCPYMETEDGFEMQIGVNHLGHFLLTNQLLDIIRQAKNARIIIVSSVGHGYGSINTSDINLRGADYGRIAAYAQSKLANILHARHLARMLKNEGITVVSLHPGSVITEINRYMPFHYLREYVGFLFTYLLKTPLEGAQTSVCCAVDPDLHKHSGEYFRDCHPIGTINAQSTNDTLAELLWNQSTNLINSKMININK